MRLKELRIKCVATQKDVAEYIMCSPTVYSRCEREEREPDIYTLGKLADFY